MLSERIEEWSKELKEEGRMEGRVEAQLRTLKENLQYLTELKCGKAAWESLSPPILAIEDPHTLEAIFREALATSSPEDLTSLLSKIPTP